MIKDRPKKKPNLILTKSKKAKRQQNLNEFETL